MGQYNSVTAATATTSCSLVAGFNNVVGSAMAAAAIGEANEITASDGGYAIGYFNKAMANRAVAIGTGTKANTANGTALGKWNNGMVSDDVLVVGTGTGDSNRVNSMKIKTDGTIVLGNSSTGKILLARPQGDISMGNYQ
jgi:hypothetical protein